MNGLRRSAPSAATATPSWRRRLAALASAAVMGLAGCASAPRPIGPPEAPPVAEVLGLPVHATSVEQMRQLVLGELSGRYAAERGLFVSETELEAYLSEQWRAANGPFRPMEHETTIERNAREKAARSLLRQRRIDGALYRQYGGRVALVDGVPVPIDAYRRFLEEQAVQGRFRILFPSLEVEFWSAFADDPRREYLPDGSEAAARAFEMPVPAPRVN